MVIKKKLTPKDKKKVQDDLDFLGMVINFTEENGLRLVVSGGYGLDGVLGEITRPHNDIDVIIHGNKSRAEYKKLLTGFISGINKKLLLNFKNDTFYLEADVNGDGLGVNIYYVQTGKDPFVSINEVIKSDGQIIVNSEKRFPPPVKANIEEIAFEAQNQNLHLADILFKRRGVELDKHEQDIENLKQITNPKIVESILSQY